jgi:serine protease AprX
MARVRALVLVCALLSLAGISQAGARTWDGELRAPSSSGGSARALVASLPRATAVNDGDGNKLFDDLDAAFRAAGTSRLPVIVSFVQGTTTDEGVALVGNVAPGAPVRRTFTIIPAYSGELGVVEALRVAELPDVRQIELDRAGVPELDTATEVMGADSVVDEMGVTGSLDGDADTATPADVGIAVLDTGFDTGHADLDGKVIAWQDFGTGRADPYDPDGHGSHVASIAAGWGRSDESLRGVAPGASIIGVKIDGGGNTTSNAIAGYEWIVENRDELGIRVATISFGFGVATDGTTALERAVDKAWDAGIVCFKSNGNSGPGTSTMTVPAAARGILAIGSLLDPFGSGGSKYGFLLSEYSSRGPTTDGRIKPDLVAPGESIRAADAGTASGSIVFSGTSMASPFAAGTAALMIAADPTLVPDQVRSLLYATAEERGASGPDNDFGHGRIQVWDAVQAALEGAGVVPAPSSPPAVPRQETRSGAPVNGLFETELQVTDVQFPVAITALGATFVHGVLVTDPSGQPVPAATAAPNGGADRQHHVTFRPTAPGTYLVRALATPGTGVVLDVSHSR